MIRVSVETMACSSCEIEPREVKSADLLELLLCNEQLLCTVAWDTLHHWVFTVDGISIFEYLYKTEWDYHQWALRVRRFFGKFLQREIELKLFLACDESYPVAGVVPSRGSIFTDRLTDCAFDVNYAFILFVDTCSDLGMKVNVVDDAREMIEFANNNRSPVISANTRLCLFDMENGVVLPQVQAEGWPTLVYYDRYELLQKLNCKNDRVLCQLALLEYLDCLEDRGDCFCHLAKDIRVPRKLEPYVATLLMLKDLTPFEVRWEIVKNKIARHRSLIDAHLRVFEKYFTSTSEDLSRPSSAVKYCLRRGLSPAVLNDNCVDLASSLHDVIKLLLRGEGRTFRRSMESYAVDQLVSLQEDERLRQLKKTLDPSHDLDIYRIEPASLRLPVLAINYWMIHSRSASCIERNLVLASIRMATSGISQRSLPMTKPPGNVEVDLEIALPFMELLRVVTAAKVLNRVLGSPLPDKGLEKLFNFWCMYFWRLEVDPASKHFHYSYRQFALAGRTYGLRPECKYGCYLCGVRI